MEEKKKSICTFFSAGKLCKNGDQCKFLHIKKTDPSSEKKQQKQDKICSNFAKNGSCPHGDKCYFSHTLPPCTYFQDDNCTREKCPFPHVKLPKAQEIAQEKAAAAEEEEIEEHVESVEDLLSKLSINESAGMLDGKGDKISADQKDDQHDNTKVSANNVEKSPQLSVSFQLESSTHDFTNDTIESTPQVNGDDVMGKAQAKQEEKQKEEVETPSVNVEESKPQALNKQEKEGDTNIPSPPCKFFQTDSCKNLDCKYPHVKLPSAGNNNSNDDAEVIEIKEFALEKAPLNWDLMKHFHFENAMRYTYWFNIQGVDKALWSADPLKYLVRSQQRTTVKVFGSFFSEGHIKTLHGLQDEHINQRLVAKVYKKPSDRTLANYQLDAQVQTIAKGLAKEFSKHPQALAAIDFISVSYYEMLSRPQNDYFKFFTAEPLMNGKYWKCEGNASNNNTLALTASQLEFGRIGQSFSHFTWEYCSSLLQCVDLQGVENIFTDPQILSKDGGKFGKNDIGSWGCAHFFKSHVCNKHCKALGLPVRYPAINTKPVTVPQEVDGNVSLVQVCCELYCGTVFATSRDDYLKELKDGREIYCAGCKDACKNQTESQKCKKCGEDFLYKSYWYRMKGMEAPKECKRKECSSIAQKKAAAEKQADAEKEEDTSSDSENPVGKKET
jgi:hypothetical protein